MSNSPSESIDWTRLIGAVGIAAEEHPSRRRRKRLHRLAQDLAAAANAEAAERAKQLPPPERPT